MAKRKRYPMGRLVLIEWEDSFGCPQGWQYADEVTPEPTIVHSVGWLLRETKHYKFIAPHMNKPGSSDRPQIAGYITIPVGAIVRQSILKAISSSRRIRRAAPA